MERVIDAAPTMRDAVDRRPVKRNPMTLIKAYLPLTLD